MWETCAIFKTNDSYTLVCGGATYTPKGRGAKQVRFPALLADGSALLSRYLCLPVRNNVKAYHYITE